MKPRILIPLPTSADHTYNAASIANYTQAVRNAGGDPIELPLSLPPAEILALARTAQGILLPGSGADVLTTRYGQPRQPESADPDLTRESVDDLLIHHAETTRTPLLCVCFGTQSLNVYRGGTLIQHLAPIPVNHSAGKAVLAAHAVDIAPQSHLGRLVREHTGDEAADRNGLLHLNVNSSHHQAIGIPGEGLRIVARSAEDGVIEAIENDPTYIPPTTNAEQPEASAASSATSTTKPHWLLALQWHPERTTEVSPLSQAIFKDFIAAASIPQPRP